MDPRKFFFTLLGVIGLLLAAGGYGYYYALAELTKASQQLSVQLGKQVAVDDELDRLNLAQKTYETTIVPLKPRMDAALPTDKNQSQLLTQLQTTARDTGVSLNRVSFSSTPGLPSATSQTIKSGSVLAIPLSFEVRGSFAQLQAFLERVENLSRLTNVSNISLNRSGETLTYTVNINTFMKP